MCIKNIEIPFSPLKPLHRYYRWMLSQAAETAGALLKASIYLIFHAL
jgi:hypothetical protein